MAEKKFQPINEPRQDFPEQNQSGQASAEPPQSLDLNALLQKARSPEEAEEIRALITEREKNIAEQRAQQRKADADRLAELVQDVLSGEGASAGEAGQASKEQSVPERDDSTDARAFKIKGRDADGLPVMEEVGIGAAQEKDVESEKSRLFRDLEERGIKIVGGQNTSGGLKTQFDKSAEEANREKRGMPSISRQDKDVRITLRGVQKQATGSIRMEGDETGQRLQAVRKKQNTGTE